MDPNPPKKKKKNIYIVSDGTKQRYKIGYQKAKSKKDKANAAKERHDLFMKATGRGSLLKNRKTKKK